MPNAKTATSTTTPVEETSADRANGYMGAYKELFETTQAQLAEMKAAQDKQSAAMKAAQDKLNEDLARERAEHAHRIAALEAAQLISPEVKEVMNTFGGSSVEDMNRALKACKTMAEKRAVFQKFANDTAEHVKKTLNLDGTVRPVVIMEKRALYLKLLGTALVTAGAGATASYYSHERGRRVGAQAVVDSRLEAWKTSDSELHMQVAGTDGKDVHVTFEEVNPANGTRSAAAPARRARSSK